MSAPSAIPTHISLSFADSTSFPFVGAPSTELSVIESRLALVDALKQINHPARYLSGLLKTLPDTPRVLQRLYLRRTSASVGLDLLALKRAILACATIQRVLLEHVPHVTEPSALEHIVDRFEAAAEVQTLAARIEDAIHESALEERLRRLEKLSQVADSLGERAVEEEEDKDKVEGVWGKTLEWVVKPG